MVESKRPVSDRGNSRL